MSVETNDIVVPSEDWAWEITLSRDYLSPKTNKLIYLEPAYNVLDFSYHGAVNLALITSQFLPTLKMFKYDPEHDLLLLFLDKEAPSNIMDKLQGAVSSDSDDPFVILNDVLTQDTSCFSIRRLSGDTCSIDFFEGLTDYTGTPDYLGMYPDLVDMDINEDNSLILAYNVRELSTVEADATRATCIEDIRYALPIIGKPSEVLTVKDSLDTLDLAYYLSNLNTSSPEEELQDVYDTLLSEVIQYVETPETFKDGEFAGFKDLKQADNKRNNNRRKNKLAKKQKAKQRRKK